MEDTTYIEAMLRAAVLASHDEDYEAGDYYRDRAARSIRTARLSLEGQAS